MADQIIRIISGAFLFFGLLLLIEGRDKLDRITCAVCLTVAYMLHMYQ